MKQAQAKVPSKFVDESVCSASSSGWVSLRAWIREKNRRAWRENWDKDSLA